MDGYEGFSSPRYGFTDPISVNLEGAVTFEAPELPEETIMEVSTKLTAFCFDSHATQFIFVSDATLLSPLQEEHTETLCRLRFMLEFVQCMMDVAESRGGEAAQADLSSTGLLQQQTLVADQISSLSREWG